MQRPCALLCPVIKDKVPLYLLPITSKVNLFVKIKTAIPVTRMAPEPHVVSSSQRPWQHIKH